MLTYPTVARLSRRAISLAIPLVLVIAACGAAAGPTATPGTQTPGETPTAVPGDGGSVGGQLPGGGGGVGGNPGGGTDPGFGGLFPLPPNPADDPLFGDAVSVVPVAGRIDPHPVNVQLVRAVIDDGNVFAELRWYSGVEECYGTDSVEVTRDDSAKTISITVNEGSVGGDVMCIEIAVLKATVVDLGPLAAGTWTIDAEGDAPAITLEVG